MGRIILFAISLVVLTSFTDIKTKQIVEATKEPISTNIDFGCVVKRLKEMSSVNKKKKIVKTVSKSTQKEIKPTLKSDIAYKTFNVSFYTSYQESTGKHRGDPTFGITASGEPVKVNYTASCPKSIDFGTKLEIPDLGHTYVCTDRGAAITSGHLDIYVKTVKEARRLGRKFLKVHIIGGD